MDILFSDCLKRKAPADGSLSKLTDVPHGGNLTVSCNSNFTLFGDNTLLCVSGNWSGQVGKCIQGETVKIVLHLF